MECIYCNSKPCICNFPEKLEGVKVLRLDTPNKNDRIYSKEVIDKALCHLSPSTSFGMVGMPVDVRHPIDLEKVSHLVENIRIEGDWLVCDIKVMETPMGTLLKQLYNWGQGGFGTAGIGDIDPETKEVTNFTLTGIHYVNEPA